jgi:hypothetical protein
MTYGWVLTKTLIHAPLPSTYQFIRYCGNHFT